jgi:hypothetical protein
LTGWGVEAGMYPIDEQRECPNCKAIQEAKPSRKHECPYCHKLILIRDRRLVTEEEAAILDWLSRLEGYGVTRGDFDKHRDELSIKFGFRAGINDTIWRILNRLVSEYVHSDTALELVYRDMARLVSGEGKDPTEFLIQAEKAARRHGRGLEIAAEKEVFLGSDELKYVHRLRSDGKLDKAEELLLKAEPSPAVLDELRKVASEMARGAKKNGEWEAVVQHLEGYVLYASKWRERCLSMGNQEPPAHTQSDIRLLCEAKERLRC